MDAFINRVSDQFSKLKEKNIAVPVSEDLLGRIIAKSQKEEVKTMTVNIKDGSLIIQGKVKKSLITIPYSITLVPDHVVERQLFFRIVKFTPLNIKELNSIIFKKRAPLILEKNKLGIDLNHIDQIRRIRVGNIRDFNISENNIVVFIGL